MKQHERFEWDKAKANANLRKHGVDLADAQDVLADPLFELFHVEVLDEVHCDETEDRWNTVGTYPLDRSVVLFIVWTERFDAVSSVTRVISARQADPGERKLDEHEIEKRLDAFTRETERARKESSRAKRKRWRP